MTPAYKVELDFNPDNINFRWDVIKHAQTLSSFLNVNVSVRRRKITVLFTEEHDAAWFKLKWV